MEPSRRHAAEAIARLRIESLSYSESTGQVARSAGKDDTKNVRSVMRIAVDGNGIKRSRTPFLWDA